MKTNILLIGLIAILVLFSGCVRVSDMSPEQLYEHALTQEEVKAVIGSNPEIIKYEVSAINAISPGDYEDMKQTVPSCASKLETGKAIRTVKIYTPSLLVRAVYNLETNSIACVYSSNISNLPPPEAQHV